MAGIKLVESINHVIIQIEKVTHDIFLTKKGDTGIGTTGDTILGADDKAGVVILMNLIEHNIPGLYYLFIGEETGCIGSSGIRRKEPDRFKKYKRCIAFDRRDYGSVITKQRGKTCCSSEFADALIKQFNTLGLIHKQDPAGIYTDSAEFMDLIPEVTNLSVGYFNEHSPSEAINITYLEKLAKASISIKWEELPVVRDLRQGDTKNPKRGPKKLGDLSDEVLDEIFYDVDDLIEQVLHVYCYNFDHFMPEKEMIYVDYYNDNRHTSVYIHEDGSISIGTQNFNTYEDLIKEMGKWYQFNPDKIGSAKLKKTNNNNDDYHDWVIPKDDDPPWWTGDSDYVSTNYNTLNYYDIVENPDNRDLGKNFTKNMDIQELLYNISYAAYTKGSKFITVPEMVKILDEYNKSVKSFIMWLDDRDNDPDKTSGLYWSVTKKMFVVELDDLD